MKSSDGSTSFRNDGTLGGHYVFVMVGCKIIRSIEGWVFTHG